MRFLQSHRTRPRWYQFKGMQDSILLLANGWKGHPFIEELIHLGWPLDGALEQAVRADDLDLVRFLLRWNWNPEELGTAFLHALMNHNKELVQLLMAAGADPANVDAFRFAIGTGSPIPSTLLAHLGARNTRRFVGKGADWEALELLIVAFRTRYPDGRNGFGADALIEALADNNIYLLRKLLQDARLDVNSHASDYWCSPLGFSIRHCREIGLEKVELLLQTGADIKAVAEVSYLDKIIIDKPPETALQVAIRTRDLQMVEFLVDRGAKVNHPARRGLKMTPLQTACSIGSYPIAEFLLNNGAEVNAPPAYTAGATALQFAAIGGSTRIVELLLQCGADIHAAPSKYHGRTALQGAAEHGRIHVLNILWERGNGRFPDEEIRMAQEFARQNRNPACAEHLDWLSEVSPAERRLQLGDLAHMAVPETETWEGEGLR
ncbi:Ankyrin repeat-containing domain protein [Rhypophila decipiens]